MLDPATGDTIEDFHNAAAKEFSELAANFLLDSGSPDSELAEETEVGEEVIEPGTTAHGGNVGEEVRQSEA